MWLLPSSSCSTNSLRICLLVSKSKTLICGTRFPVNVTSSGGRLQLNIPYPYSSGCKCNHSPTLSHTISLELQHLNIYPINHTFDELYARWDTLLQSANSVLTVAIVFFWWWCRNDAARKVICHVTVLIKPGRMVKIWKMNKVVL